MADCHGKHDFSGAATTRTVCPFDVGLKFCFDADAVNRFAIVLLFRVGFVWSFVLVHALFFFFFENRDVRLGFFSSVLSIIAIVLIVRFEFCFV